MRLLLFVLSLSSVFLFSASPAYSALTAEEIAAKIAKMDAVLERRVVNTWIAQQPKFAAKYAKMLKRVYDRRDDIEGAVRSLRLAYAKSAQYTPFSETVIDDLTHYAYIADTSSDRTEVNEALSQYRALLNAHLANYDVVLFALRFSLLDVMYGDSVFLRKVKRALETNFHMDIRFGTRPGEAYRIMTYGEETSLLMQYGGALQRSELFEVSGEFYNVHDIETENGQILQIFINVTAPIHGVNIRKLVREQQKRIDISGQ